MCVNQQQTGCIIYTTLQECVVYLCGTKVDLVEENKKARKVDVHTVRDYSEGEWLL